MMKYIILFLIFSVTLIAATAGVKNNEGNQGKLSPTDTSIVMETPAVTINTFTATQTDENVAILKWSINFHANVTSFEIQRREKNENVWKTISEGNNIFKTFTNYTDYTLASSDVKYRIRIKDEKGKFYYSKVAEVKEKELSHGLYQNYPNPFNPSTSISYKVSTPGYVYLKVFNLLGNEVATLVDEFKGTGVYKADFDASYVTGGLSSGIYFYKLIIGNYVETKKMTFSK